MEQASFRMLDTWEDTFLKLKKDLEYLFNSKLSGDDMLAGSIQGDKMVTIIDDRSTSLVYSPAAQLASTSDPWYRFTNDIYFYDNTVTRGIGDLATQQSVTYTFTGGEVSVIASPDAWGGKIDVYIDGTLDSTVDMYTVGTIGRQAVYTKTGLERNKQHTIKIIVRSDKNASSSGYRFDFDGFRVGEPIGLKNIDIVTESYSISGTASTNGYKEFDTQGFAPDGYSVLGVIGATLGTPDPSTSGTKPKVGHGARYIDVWDAGVSAAVKVYVAALYIKK